MWADGTDFESDEDSRRIQAFLDERNRPEPAVGDVARAHTPPAYDIVLPGQAFPASATTKWHGTYLPIDNV